MADTNPSTPSPLAKAEFACPDCGEMVREGLVRCWNCGGFLRPEMEERFQKMQEKPAKVILSEVREQAADDKDLDTMMTSRARSGSGGDDDFEISTPVRQVAAPTTTGTEDSEASEASTAEAESKEAPAGDAEQRASAGGEDDVPHSVATGGDSLLELAAAEEQEKAKRQGNRAAGLEGVKVIRDGFLIDAPKGCRIQVRDERTGEMRRLTFGASSRVRISMLDKLEAIAKARKDAEKKGEAKPKYVSAGKFQRWVTDVHLHTINPAKLKLIADSMAKEFVPVDIGFAEDELLLVSLPVAKKSLFGGGKGPETPQAAREELLQHIRAGKSLDGEKVTVTGDIKASYTADQVAELRVVQPAASMTESLFAGIPVFGQGRIAVQVPVTAAGEHPRVLSFTLTQFREFDEIVASTYSMAEFGRNLGIPLTDSFKEHKCHFSNVVIKELEHLEYYTADPDLETVLVGYKCEACGIAISEEARKKENLGGKAAKGIAKTKCLKCEAKMGNVPIYSLPSQAKEPSMQGDDGSDEDVPKQTNKAAPMEPAGDSSAADDTTEQTAEKTGGTTADGKQASAEEKSDAAAKSGKSDK